MKKILTILTIIFFSAMLILTCFAEGIHNAFLPKVTASRLEQKPFSNEYTDQNGNIQTGTVQKPALPESMLGQDIYVIYAAEKNGTERNFVRFADVRTGERVNGYVEVVSGIVFSDRVVVESSGDLFEGCEVFIDG